MDGKRQCLKEPRAAGRIERVASESVANYLLALWFWTIFFFFFFFIIYLFGN